MAFRPVGADGADLTSRNVVRAAVDAAPDAGAAFVKLPESVRSDRSVFAEGDRQVAVNDALFAAAMADHLAVTGGPESGRQIWLTDDKK